MKSGVVLVAAGSGRRFGQSLPKQFLSIAGKPLFLHSLDVFNKCPRVKEIVVVVAKCFFHKVTKRVERLGTRKTIKVVLGGSFRGASVRNGVKAISPKLDVLLVHDAARPGVTPDIVKRVEDAAFKKGAALAAWPLPDTLKRGSKTGRVIKTIPRENLWLAQTPQGFRMNIARQFLLKPKKNATDDVELVERRNIPVALVLGSPTNLKVTYSHDLKFCEGFL